jgi:hypothetical protein
MFAIDAESFNVYMGMGFLEFSQVDIVAPRKTWQASSFTSSNNYGLSLDKYGVGLQGEIFVQSSNSASIYVGEVSRNCPVNKSIPMGMEGRAIGWRGSGVLYTNTAGPMQLLPANSSRISIQFAPNTIGNNPRWSFGSARDGIGQINPGSPYAVNLDYNNCGPLIQDSFYFTCDGVNNVSAYENYII